MLKLAVFHYFGARKNIFMKKLIIISLLALSFSAAYCLAGDNTTVQSGKQVAFDYTLKVNGKVVDSSEGKEPLSYRHGGKSIIPGLSKQLEGMTAGEEKVIVVTPEEGYGEVNPKAFKEVSKSLLPAKMNPKVGVYFQIKGSNGRTAIARIAELNGEKVLLDFNHPLAGKTLEFDIKIVSIQ